MGISQLKDRELLAATKTLVGDERRLLTKVLQHLREIDRRRLYCDLGYSSLFDYAVRELRYSEGQAGRRIQAMRLIAELPQVEKSIASGELSLSNVSQAQSLFKQIKKETPAQPMARSEKLALLNSLKNKSAREGQKEILKIQPSTISAKSLEKERIVAEDATEVRFVMNDQLKAKLEQVRSLLGPKAIDMSYAQLFDAMADLSIAGLAAKKFGKRRAAAGQSDKSTLKPNPVQVVPKEPGSASKLSLAPTSELATDSAPRPSSPNPRYISQGIKHAVWQRDRGKCSNCRSSRNLQIDHIVPVAHGGQAVLSNLRLLCFPCNQRAGIKIFGREKMVSG